MASSPPAAFIHFGLGKCASTFLQNVWSLDPQYTAVDVSQAADGIRKLAERDQINTLPPFKLAVKPKPGTRMAVYSEGLTWGYLRRPELQSRLPRMHEFSAQIMGRSGTAPIALFVVRDPLAWIRSVHEQTIKEGRSENGTAFLQLHRNLIESLLDLKRIIALFRSEFVKVVVLNSDDLRENPDRFWNEYETQLDAPRPSRSVIDKVSKDEHLSNASLKDRLSYLAAFNRTFSLLNEAWAGLSDVPGFVDSERRRLIPKFADTSRWATRRIAEYADIDKLERLGELMGYPLEPDFQALPLDAGLIDMIQTRFCDALEKVDGFPKARIDAYRHGLTLSTSS